jgi:hypothetical protein
MQRVRSHWPSLLSCQHLCCWGEYIWEKFPKLVCWVLVFHTPAVTFDLKISWLHPSVPFALLHKHVVSVLIFLQDTLWGCVYVHRATWPAVCLFPIHSFCLIHRECYRCSVPSVVDFFLAWSHEWTLGLWFGLKMVLLLWQFPMHLNFSEIPFT